MKVDIAAIRARARQHWGAHKRTEVTLAASFDAYQLLAEIARLERRLTAIQTDRKPPKPARPRMVTVSCECGCGAKVRRRFAAGHNLVVAPEGVRARDAARAAAKGGEAA